MSQELIIDGLMIPVETDTIDAYLDAAAQRLQIPRQDIELIRIIFKKLLTEDTRRLRFELTLAVRAPDGCTVPDGVQPFIERRLKLPARPPLAQRPIIIGFGPAGIFAALALIECGQAPLIFERGQPIAQRHQDIRRFIDRRILSPESNIQFGEGGAGLYSDGKLFSSRNNSVYAQRALETFVRFGAPPEILFMHKPHIGTDMLCTIVATMRDHILAHGGEIHYNAKMTDIIISDNRVQGVVINGTDRHLSSNIFLALGNSPRDTFEMMHAKGIVLEPKPIAVGVRIEHPVQTINRMVYGHGYHHRAALGAATYFFNYVNRHTRRAAYSFCMCPGGEVVNASSQQQMLVINGMSHAARDSRFSNAAIVVGCTPADYPSTHPLAGIRFQQEIEKKAFRMGGGNWKAPAQNLMDFLHRRSSSALLRGSLKTGLHPCRIDGVFPDFVNDTLRQAFRFWKKEFPQFISEEAVIMAAETRTSSPVRIKRKKNFQSVNTAGLYPIGEGSGYSGGINSAAIDGLRAVETVMGQP